MPQEETSHETLEGEPNPTGNPTGSPSGSPGPMARKELQDSPRGPHLVHRLIPEGTWREFIREEEEVSN